METVSFVYNHANQIACRDGNANGICGDVGDIPYEYDSYGNLTSDGRNLYAYDAENRLVSATEGGRTTTYAYNGDGDRVSQMVNGVVTSYILDTATPLTMVLAETTGTGTIHYLQGLDLIAQNDGVDTTYFGYDGLGSVRQLVDSTGKVLLAQAFDPYGNPYAEEGTDSTSWGYTGEQTDANGLVFLRARYYDPRQGRFLPRIPGKAILISQCLLTPGCMVLEIPSTMSTRVEGARIMTEMGNAIPSGIVISCPRNFEKSACHAMSVLLPAGLDLMAQ